MERAHEYEGIVAAGEVPVVIRRDSPVEADHSQAYRSGAEAAFRIALGMAEGVRANIPPYTDPRSVDEIITSLQDRIRAVNDGTA